MANSSCWVMEMEKMIGETEPAAERARWSKHSIYKLPEWVKDMTNRRAYVPFLVSLGPLHHGEVALQPMEAHKRRAVVRVVKRSGKPLQEFVDAVDAVAKQLEDAYEDVGDEWQGRRRRFVELMIVDGCFLLEVMRMEMHAGLLRGDYPANDPVFSEHGFLYLLEVIRSDVLLMENQLPLLLLQKLVALQQGSTPMNNMILDFLGRHKMVGSNTLGLHPLDIFHKSFCGVGQVTTRTKATEEFMPSAMGLYEAGVHFSLSSTNKDNLQGIQFERGVLTMPLVSIDNSTEKMLLNLMALEQLHPDAGNDVTAFVFFMDNIIDTAKDVALLKSKEIIKSAVGSDEEVAKLFNNSISKLAVMSLGSRIHDVHLQLNAHCSKRWNRVRASFKHTYLSSPWVFISLLAAFLLLLASVMQTVYTVYSVYKS